LTVHVWGDTHPGQLREINEDSYYCPTKQTKSYKKIDQATLSSKGYLLIVADGIGGSDLGQRASREVVQSLRDVFYETPLAGTPDQRLYHAVQYANDSLYQMRTRNPALGQAGSTVVAAVVQNNYLYVANAGDSRAYLIRDGQASQRTKDHTLIAEKVARGLPPAETDKGVITRSLGEKPTMPADLYTATALQDGDAVLLCSDGLTDLVTDEELAKIISDNPPQKAVEKLVKLANQRGGPDNITVVIAQIGHGKAAPPPFVFRRRQKIMLAVAFIIGLIIWAIVLLALFSSPDNGRVSATATPANASPQAAPTTTLPADVTATPSRAPTVTPVAGTATHTPAPMDSVVTPPEAPAEAAPTPTSPALPAVTPTVECPSGQFWDAIMGRCRPNPAGGPEPTKSRP
jgi:protein phosphatase